MTDEDEIVCPVCGNNNSPDSTECRVCGTSLEKVKEEKDKIEDGEERVKLENEEEAILNALTHISGVGQSKAKNIVKSGISDFDKLEGADLSSFLNIEGIGESTAIDIIETIEGSKKGDGGLYLCGECGGFVGERATKCPQCGAKMIEEDEDYEEDYDGDLDHEEVLEEGEEEGSLYLCGNCGSFISSSAEKCPFCGSSLEEEEEEEEEIGEEEEFTPIEEDIQEGEEEEEGGLYLCTNCGSFVSSKSNRCSQCGYYFDEEEEVTPEEIERREEELIDESITEREPGQIPETDLEPETMMADISDETQEPDEMEELVQDSVTEVEPESEQITEMEEDETLDEMEELVQDSITEVEPESEQITEMEEDQTLDEMEDLVQTEDWTEEELEMDIDETDLEELDKEIELALEEEYGISSETIRALSLGKDIKMCGNCGRICEGELKECPVCHQPLEGGKVEAEMETEEWDVESAQSTLIQALGISDVPDEVSEDETGSLGVCTICGAFLTEGTERCPVCGSKVSETPEIEYDEEDTFVHRTDDKLFICDACGAFVGADQKFCPVCGSDLEFARRKVEEEDIESIGDNTQDILDSFFGEIDGVEIEEEMKNKKLTFCDVCGALVIEGADRCSICLSLLDEEKSEEEELQGFEFYFGEDEISEEEMEEFDEEINVTEVDEDFTPEIEEESQVDASEEIMKEVDRELELEEDENLSEDIDETSEIEGGTEEGVEEGEEIIIDEDLLERELELDIEEEPESVEMQEDEDATEDDFQIYEEVDEVGEIEEVEEPEPSEEEEIDIESILEEISEENEKVTAETTEKPLDEGGEFGYYRVEESDHSGEPLDEELETDDLNEDEWTHCPNCDSYVSDDSEVCGVCGYSFEESGIPERNVSMYHKKIERRSDISSASGTEVNTHDSSWINEILQEADSSSSKKKRRGKVRKESEDENLLVSTVNRIKEYEVPVSSLSLVAFGGFYLYSYQNSSLPNIADIGLTILALFFGLGILTLYVFKEDLIRTSQTGVIGYLIGFGLASFVPLHCTVLSISLPLILDTLLIGIALGIFIILDFKIDQDYRYYLMWFVGIALLMLILILVKITDTGGLTTLAYPLLMSIGLGSVLVMGGTYNWYNRAQSDTNTYENIQIGHRHLLYGDYKKAVSSFDKAIKNSSQMDKDANNIDYAESPLYSKGLAQCSMGMYEDAAETFKEVLSLAPESVACWNNLGTTYSRMGKQKLAIKCLKKSLKLEPEYEISWNNLGNAMFRKGEYDKALDCYDMALDINPNYRDATLNKNQCLIKLGTSKTR